MFACILIRGARATPQDHATPEALLQALTPFDQADVQGQWANEHVLMVQALTWNTPQSHHEHAPEVCPETGRVIASWVRLDNRAELCAALDLRDTPELTDPQIILAAHRLWGADCANELEGDFSFVLYDPEKKQVFCARDSIGAKPFFYYADKTVFIAASTAAILRVLKKITVSPSQKWMVRQVMWLPHDLTQSAYEDVLRLAPAHSLTVAREGAVEPREYFRFKDMAPTADTRDPAYVEAYREAFHAAVERRLRSGYLVGAENSGGLDSVSIMGHAVRHLPHDIEDFHCFGLPKQERDAGLILEASMHAKVRHTHLATHMIAYGDTENFDRAITVMGHPVEHAQIDVHMAALRQSRALGIRTMLSGYGGDEIVTNQARALDMELHNHRQFKTLLSEMRGNLLTRRLRFVKRINALRRRDPHSRKLLYFLERGLKWSPFRRDVLEDMGIRSDYQAQLAPKVQAETLNDSLLDDLAFNRFRVGRLEACTVMAQSHRVEYRWPLYDRALIQQYLKTPALEKRSKAMGRYLHRRAVAGSIPDSITWQQSKDMGVLVDDAFNRPLPDQLHDSSVSSHLGQLLDFGRLQAMHAEIKAAQNGAKRDRSEGSVVQTAIYWEVVRMARWLKT